MEKRLFEIDPENKVINTMPETERINEIDIEMVQVDICSEIIAVCNAINTITEIDTAMMDRATQRQIKDTVVKSLAIINKHISELYDSYFSE